MCMHARACTHTCTHTQSLSLSNIILHFPRSSSSAFLHLSLLFPLILSYLFYSVWILFSGIFLSPRMEHQLASFENSLGSSYFGHLIPYHECLVLTPELEYAKNPLMFAVLLKLIHHGSRFPTCDFRTLLFSVLSKHPITSSASFHTDPNMTHTGGGLSPGFHILCIL